MDCGNKFREVDEFINEKRKESILAVIVGVICVALVVFVMRDEGIGWRIGLLVFGVVAIWAAYSNMKEREELEVKKYESECYKNQKK